MFILIYVVVFKISPKLHSLNIENVSELQRKCEGFNHFLGGILWTDQHDNMNIINYNNVLSLISSIYNMLEKFKIYTRTLWKLFFVCVCVSQLQRMIQLNPVLNLIINLILIVHWPLKAYGIILEVMFPICFFIPFTSRTFLSNFCQHSFYQ